MHQGTTATTPLTSQPPRDQRVTAAGVYVATAAYNEALRKPNPAATLDDMCDAVADLATDVYKTVKVEGGTEFAETLQTTIADTLSAFTAIEYARTEAGDGYGCIFDLLADDLRAGRDPHFVKKTALDVPQRLRAIAAQAEVTA